MPERDMPNISEPEQPNHKLGITPDIERRLREALAFYADPAHWLASGAIQTPGMHPLIESPVAMDAGERAREALDD